MSWADRRLKALRKAKKETAYHEAGHAVAARLLNVPIVEAGVEKRNGLPHVLTRSAGDMARGTPDFRNGLEADSRTRWRHRPTILLTTVLSGEPDEG